jgi:ubiquinone/menaquinone biosynthesis C-methylase UbiE
MGDALPPDFDPAIAEYYRGYSEKDRLRRRGGLVEAARTRDVIARHLPATPVRVLDVGGGPGAYAEWLEEIGHDVVLVDPMPSHVDEAARRLRRGTAKVGDARRLDETDASFDAALVLGPLYHLIDQGDRLLALREARRVVRPGGVVFASAISRFASAFDGIARGGLADAAFAKIVDDDLSCGVHRNDDGRPEWFTTAYFHRADELRDEAAAAGFVDVDVVGLEGPTWLLADVDAQWADPARRGRWLDVLRRIEREPSLLGVSAHLLAVARRPE